LYENEEQAQALAKFDEDENQTRPLANIMNNVNGYQKLAINWIAREVRKIVEDFEDGGLRKKKNQSQNGAKGWKTKLGATSYPELGAKGRRTELGTKRRRTEFRTKRRRTKLQKKGGTY
jgi:hypothetical protein